MDLQIGCINRPWNKYELSEAMDGIAAAGFRTMGFMLQQGTYSVSAETTAEELAETAGHLKARGLDLEMALCPLSLDKPTDEAAAEFGKAVANAKQLGVTYMLTGGTMNEAMYEKFYEVARAVCDDAADADMQIVLKPHGGCSATATELLTAVEKIDKPNFGICYDPGNIYYYTGLPAEEDLPKVVQHVTCMCVKDERGGKEGEVMITPGTGDVDFKTIFSILRDASFSGPSWIECLGGETLEEINAEAVKAKQFLDGVLAEL